MFSESVGCIVARGQHHSIHELLHGENIALLEFSGGADDLRLRFCDLDGHLAWLHAISRTELKHRHEGHHLGDAGHLSLVGRFPGHFNILSHTIVKTKRLSRNFQSFELMGLVFLPKRDRPNILDVEGSLHFLALIGLVESDLTLNQGLGCQFTLLFLISWSLGWQKARKYSQWWMVDSHRARLILGDGGALLLI
jgi:hypothetical protein